MGQEVFEKQAERLSHGVNNNNKSNNNYVRAVRGGTCSLLSFRSVHNAYMDCRKRKRGTINALRFEADLCGNLYRLALELQKGTYLPSRSVCFVATTPKLREVFAADFRDRIVHHLLVREMEKLYEPCFIHDSYACRVNKGTQAAVKRLREFMLRATKNRKVPAYFLQLDIRSFFTSIDKSILFSLLDQKLSANPEKVREPETLRELVRLVVFHDCTRDYIFRGDTALLEKIPPHKTLFKVAPGKGLPIGNLTSQFFANVYLNELDHFVKQTLRCPLYLRYVDDFILLDRSAERLSLWHEQIEAFLKDKLALELKSGNAVKAVSDGANFLGYIVRPHYILVRRRVVNNLKAKLAFFQSRTCSEHSFPMKREQNILNAAQEKSPSITLSKRGKHRVVRIVLEPETVAALRQTLASYLGHFRHANARNLTEAIFEKRPWLREIFFLHEGMLIERFRYPGCFRSLKIQKFFYRDRLKNYVLLFEVGGFVELYGQDALLASTHLGCTIRKGFRGMDAVAGFPKRFAAQKIHALITLGYSVAFIAQGGDGKYVRERYVKELYRVAA